MKCLLIAVGLLGCVACNQSRIPEEGFERNPKSGDSTVFVGQGQSCISDIGQLTLAIKYPTRLPKGVSVKAISNLEFMLRTWDEITSRFPKQRRASRPGFSKSNREVISSWILTARSDALVGAGGSISDILGVVVGEPKATLTTNCDTKYQPI